MRTFVIIFLMTTVAGGVAGESYIVPFWGTGVQGSDGVWWSRASVTNSASWPIEVRVGRIFPLATRDAECTAAKPSIHLEPGSSTVLTPGCTDSDTLLVSGAFEVTATGPLKFDVVAYRAAEHEIRQRIPVGVRWLEPGMQTISTVERGAHAWRINLFLVNPTDEVLEVNAWTFARGENEVAAKIPPGRTALLTLPPPKCNGVPCPFPDTYPPGPIAVHIEANAHFFASASTVSHGWAVFTLADGAIP